MATDDTNDPLRYVLAARTSTVRSERVHELVSTAFDAVKRTRVRQQRSRDFLAGRILPHYPGKIAESFARNGRDVINYTSPQTQFIPVKLIATLADRWPRLKRDETSYGRESESVSTRIERAAEGMMYEQYPYPRSCDLLLIDGEAGTLVVPSVAHWAAPADQYEYVAPEEWKQLPDELKELWDWRPGEGQDGSGRYRRFARKYRRDGQGRPPWDTAYLDDDGEPMEQMFREDPEATAAAILDTIEQRVRSRIPTELSMYDYGSVAALNPRFGGRNERIRVDGLAIREKFDSIDLYARGYRWGTRQMGALQPADSMTRSTPVTLETLALTDHDGRPYLVYAVDGHETWRKGDGEDDWSEKLDLYDRWGIDFLPVAYEYGVHFATTAPDDRVIPYMEPLMGGLLLRDKIITTTDFHAGQTAYGGWFIEVDPAALEALGETGKKPKYEIEPLKALPIPGRATPAVHPGASQVVLVLKEFADADMDEAGVNPAALGGEGATGMMDRAMIVRDSRRGMSQVWAGVDSLFSRTGSNQLRVVANLAAKRGKPIVLNVLTEVPGEHPGEPASATRSKVVIDGDMCGGDYLLRTERPDRWGDDQATQALVMEAHDRGKATWAEMRATVGDTAPQQTFANVVVEKWLTSEHGMQTVLMDADRINMDAARIKHEMLMAQGRVDEEGVPTAMGAGVVDPSQLLPQPNESRAAMPGAPGSAGDGGTGTSGSAAVGAQRAAARGSGLVEQITTAGGDGSQLLGAA